MPHHFELTTRIQPTVCLLTCRLIWMLHPLEAILNWCQNAESLIENIGERKRALSPAIRDIGVLSNSQIKTVDSRVWCEPLTAAVSIRSPQAYTGT